MRFGLFGCWFVGCWLLVLRGGLLVFRVGGFDAAIGNLDVITLWFGLFVFLLMFLFGLLIVVFGVVRLVWLLVVMAYVCLSCCLLLVCC